MIQPLDEATAILTDASSYSALADRNLMLLLRAEAAPYL